jgi:hypothetical protein
MLWKKVQVEPCLEFLLSGEKQSVRHSGCWLSLSFVGTRCAPKFELLGIQLPGRCSQTFLSLVGS